MAAGGKLPRRIDASIRPTSTIDQTMMAARARSTRTSGSMVADGIGDDE